MSFKYHLKTVANRIASTIANREPFSMNYLERLQHLQIVAKDHDAAYRQATREVGPRITLFNPIGYTFQTFVTAVLAHALGLRGARVQVFICDGVVPQCERRAITRDHGLATCRECIGVNQTVFDALKISCRKLSECVTASVRQDAKRFIDSAAAEDLWHSHINSLPAGGMARAGALRYFFQSDLDLDEHLQREVAGQFLYSSALISHACPLIFDALSPDRVILVDGVYTYSGLYSHYARHQGIPTYVWNRGYRKNTITMSLGGNEGEVLPGLNEAIWYGDGLSHEAAGELDEYLASRKTNANDFRVFIDQPILDSRALAAELGLETGIKTIAVFPNVAWDVAVLADDVPFAGMDDWLVATIKGLATQDVQVVLRVHPYEADSWNQTRSGVQATLRRHFGSLPENVKLIPPESKLSSYALVPYLDGAIVFSSKIGMELACFSVPVLTGGVAFYRGKGFTIDACSQADYLAKVRALADRGPLSTQQTERARCFAHYYFFRHYVPLQALDCVDETGLGIQGLCDLLPGRDPYLDSLCESTLNGHHHCVPRDGIRRQTQEPPPC